MPENEPAMELWLAVQSQWRAGGMGVIGLDYAEVRWWAGELGIDLTPGVWSKVKALERATLEACHDETDRARDHQAAARPQG